MRLFKRIFVLVPIVLLLVVSACSNEKSEGSEDNNGKSEIELWHTMSGSNGEHFEDLIDSFNEQSDSIQVKTVYQGSYQDINKKIQAGGQSQSMPALVMTNEAMQKFMINNEFIEPMYKFIEEDDYDTSKLEPLIMGRYEIDNKLYSMPLGTSNTVFYYNKDLFEEAGLDPDDPPETYSEIEDAAQSIKDETGETGFSMAINSLLFDSYLAQQNALYVDKDNGQSGEPTKALFNQEEGLDFFEWINNMNQKGSLKNFGREWDDVSTAFSAGDVGMITHTSAALRDFVDDSDFDVGVGKFPRQDETESNGTPVGGSALWITKSVSDEEKDSAWEVIKFLTSAESQAEWAANTGYVPTRKDSYDEDILKEQHDKYPQLETVSEQVQNAEVNPASKGITMDNYEETQEVIQNSWEEMYDGKDPKTALKEAEDEINEILSK